MKTRKNKSPNYRIRNIYFKERRKEMQWKNHSFGHLIVTQRKLKKVIFPRVYRPRNYERIKKEGEIFYWRTYKTRRG